MQLLATAACPASTGRDDPTPDWSALLPAEWRAMADAPLRFVEYRENEMPASRGFYSFAPTAPR